MSFKEYAKLCHLQTASQIIVIPIIGALATQCSINYIDIIIFLLIGVCVNIFGFTHNEYLDVEIDRASDDLSAKPLVKGTIPKKHALIIAYVSLIAAYAITILFFTQLIALAVFTISIALAGIYNLIGKKFAGIDFLLGGWAFFLCLFGAIVFTLNITFAVYVFASLILLQWWFANIIEGGVKDAEHDFSIGVKNTTTLWGVRVNRGKLVVPLSYKIFGFSLTIGYVILMALPFIFFGFRIQIWQLIALIILAGAVIYSAAKILTMVDFNRYLILKYIIISELSKAFIPPILLVSLIGINAVLLIGFIFIWSYIFHVYEYGTAPPSI